MGLFEKIFPRPGRMSSDTYFKSLTAYQPTFTSWHGQIYESELVRAAIHAKAKHIGKLRVEINGAANKRLRTLMKHAPNEWQTWGQFLYRLSTILDMQNTAFIVPVTDQYGDIQGIYPILPSKCELRQMKNGDPWLVYRFDNGQTAAVELNRCGIMTKFQYKNDFFGESNNALNNTLSLINMQNQGIEEAVKSSATFRFMAKLNNFTKPEDLKKEQQRFTKENLSGDSGGMLLFPNTYSDIQQIKGAPYVVDPEQMTMIRTNVYDYFGVNEDVMQNKTFGDAWAAFYEGEIEPFAIQFSEVVSAMLFTKRERTEGNEVMATANRLQYMTNADKLNVSAQMADRGILTINEIREIWNLAPVEGGDVRIIRGEYYNTEEKEGETNGTDKTTES